MLKEFLQEENPKLNQMEIKIYKRLRRTGNGNSVGKQEVFVVVTETSVLCPESLLFTELFWKKSLQGDKRLRRRHEFLASGLTLPF